jgi:hypothetical protein
VTAVGFACGLAKLAGRGAGVLLEEAVEIGDVVSQHVEAAKPVYRGRP